MITAHIVCDRCQAERHVILETTTVNLPDKWASEWFPTVEKTKTLCDKCMQDLENGREAARHAGQQMMRDWWGV